MSISSSAKEEERARCLEGTALERLLNGKAVPGNVVADCLLAQHVHSDA